MEVLQKLARESRVGRRFPGNRRKIISHYLTGKPVATAFNCSDVRRIYKDVKKFYSTGDEPSRT
jgi:hypothetical protein